MTFSNLFLLFASVVFTFDIEKSKEFYLYTVTSICSDQSILNWNCSYPCQQVTHLQDTKLVFNAKYQVKGFMGYNQQLNRIIVVFRGTVDITNILEDSKFFLRDYLFCNGCKIHSGFDDAYASIQDQFLENFLYFQMKYPDVEIHFTGHSLGAALTTLASLELKRFGRNVQSLMTFGGPRTGNQNFAEYVKNMIPDVTRVVNYIDPIPHLPYVWLNYRHPTQEVWLKEDQIFQICSETNGEDPECANSIAWRKTKLSYHTSYFSFNPKCVEQQ